MKVSMYLSLFFRYCCFRFERNQFFLFLKNDEKLILNASTSVTKMTKTRDILSLSLLFVGNFVFVFGGSNFCKERRNGGNPKPTRGSGGNGEGGGGEGTGLAQRGVTYFSHPSPHTVTYPIQIHLKIVPLFFPTFHFHVGTTNDPTFP